MYTDIKCKKSIYKIRHTYIYICNIQWTNNAIMIYCICKENDDVYIKLVQRSMYQATNPVGGPNNVQHNAVCVYFSWFTHYIGWLLKMAHVSRKPHVLLLDPPVHVTTMSKVQTPRKTIVVWCEKGTFPKTKGVHCSSSNIIYIYIIFKMTIYDHLRVFLVFRQIPHAYCFNLFQQLKKPDAIWFPWVPLRQLWLSKVRYLR